MGSLLSQLLGSPDLSNVDNTIDNIIQTLHSSDSSQDENETKNLNDITGDFLGLIQKEEAEKNEDDGNNRELDQLFQNINIPNQRLQRYNLYDELYQSVPLVKRILTVYISNIVPKNPVNDDVFIYNELENVANSDDVNLSQQKSQYKKIVEKYSLSSKLKKNILPYRLKYGDYFVEVVNVNEMLSLSKLKSTISSNTSMIISECEQITSSLTTLSEHNFDNILHKASTLLIDYSDYDVDLINMHNMVDIKETQTSFDTVFAEANQDQDQDSENTINFDNVLLRYHLPHNIVILETKYGTTLGYLEVNKDLNSQNNGSSSISSMVQKVVSKGKDSQKENVDKLIKHVLSNIFNKTYSTNKNKSSKSIDSIISSLSPDVFMFIKRLIIENDLSSSNGMSSINKIKVRFIPPKNMVHFSNPDGSEYLPFASSVFDPLLLPGKLYMLTQLSNIITKLSRASVIRKWTLDMGSSKMSKQNLNKLKREIYNTRVTLNDLGSFKSISKILSDFRDMFAISQNGRTPVDMSIENAGDPNIKTEDLRDLRNELVSMSGVNFIIAPSYSNVC